MHKLILGSTNEGKVREFSTILREILPNTVQYIPPTPSHLIEQIEENGKSFFENAQIKAEAICKIMNMPTLADDSGLVIDSLGGKPGILSARYASAEHSTGKPEMKDNIARILSEMHGIPPKQRTARFICALHLVTPKGDFWKAEGVWEGYIAEQPEGTHGFGYDPIFICKEYKKHVACISQGQKNTMSHRRKAIEQLFTNITLEEIWK